MCIAIIIALSVTKKKQTKRKRWAKEWNAKRKKYTHLNILNKVLLSDPKDYQNYFRMSDVIYNQLLNMLRPFITKMDTNMRDSIPANERLAVTLRYLATGRSFEDLKFSSIISPTTISMIVIETCEAIVAVLKDFIQVYRTLF